MTELGETDLLGKDKQMNTYMKSMMVLHNVFRKCVLFCQMF